MYTHIYIYIYIFIYLYTRSLYFAAAGLVMVGSMRRWATSGLALRSVFEVSIWRDGPQTLELGTLRGRFEAETGRASGIRDPRFERFRAELVIIGSVVELVSVAIVSMMVGCCYHQHVCRR